MSSVRREGGWQVIKFTVTGIPQPQGSARAFVPKGWKRAIITSDNKTLKPWRQDVADMAKRAMDSHSILARPGAVTVSVDFYFDRPKSQKKATHKTTKPDLDKTLRAIFDSLTGIVFEDDSQITACSATKGFGQPARAEIRVEGIGL